ncbi:MAG: hypothetical protein U9Q38_06355, partial [Thermodesulfobacteriota bacterium]|nr:hypothetical protein [Thermodesulfobacteriota bacterium]
MNTIDQAFEEKLAAQTQRANDILHEKARTTLEYHEDEMIAAVAAINQSIDYYNGIVESALSEFEDHIMQP